MSYTVHWASEDTLLPMFQLLILRMLMMLLKDPDSILCAVLCVVLRLRLNVHLCSALGININLLHHYNSHLVSLPGLLNCHMWHFVRVNVALARYL